MKKITTLLSCLFLLCWSVSVGQSDETKQLVDMVKKNLGASMQNLKNYEWLETTTVFYKGEQKSSKQNQCYYSVDNKLTKVPAGDASDDKQARGLRGRIAENKKEEMSDYAEKCIEKIQKYLPPASDKLQAVYASGKASVQALQPGKLYTLNFTNYLEAADQVGITIDKTKALLTKIAVLTSVNDPSDKITFSISYSQLPDGTEYPAETILDMPSKQLKIVISQGGFKKAAR